VSSQQLQSGGCCADACETVTTTVPGPQGDPGAAGTNGTDGSNAFTILAAGFTMPNRQDQAVPHTVVAAVADTSWMVLGQILFVQVAGYMSVSAIGGATSVTLENLRDDTTSEYPDNANSGTAIPNASKVSPAGLQGPAGVSAGAAAPVDATYITQTPNGTLTNEQALSLLATGYAKVTTGTGVVSSQAVPIPVADGGTGGITAAAARTALGAAPSVATYITQVAEAGLSAEQSLAALATGYMKVTTATGVVTSQAVPIPLTDGGTGGITAAAARTSLEVLAGYGLIGFKNTVNLNSANTDNAITMLSSRYLIDRVTLESPSAAVTTATAGLFTAAGGGGTTLCADQALAGSLTATTKIMDLVEQAIVGTDERTEGTLYFRTGTAEGAARTVNLRIYGFAYEQGD
jgi:hypothetical protein